MKALNRSFWDHYARVYDLVTRSGDAELAEAGAWIAGFLRPCDRILDAACGTGAFACLLASKVEFVMACDYSEKMLARARRKAAHHCLHNIAFRVQDITALSLPAGVFDAAVCANVLHLLDSPEDAIAHLKRVVRPGGLIIVPNYVHGTRAGSGRMKLLRRFGFESAHDWDGGAFEAFLSEQGLRIIEKRLFDAWQPLDVVACRADGGSEGSHAE